MEKNARIYVAGHRGMVGSAILRALQREGYTNIVYRTSSEMDLRNSAAVADFFDKEKPEYVFMAAAKVGGIKANSEYPADFLMDNLEMQTNIFRNAFRTSVKKMVFLASACMMPKLAPQPMKEDLILTAPCEPTNEAYAIAKIAGTRACEYYNKQYGCDYTAVIPANAYGINDSFDLNNSHVIPALIRKFDSAREEGKTEVEMWGTGSPLREFLYVDDLADACLFVMDHSMPAVVNIGSGQEISMNQLAELIKEITGFNGTIVRDTTKPDGMPRRIVDTSVLDGLGWKPGTDIKDGLQKTYKWYLENIKEKKV